jgi:AraC-like DNA-binding protein
MVCNRCIMAVRETFEQIGLQPTNVSLGEVELLHEPSEKEIQKLNARLNKLGFEILDDTKKKIIEKIKKLIIEQVHYNKGDDRFNLSQVLSSSLHKDYSYLSNLFSEVEGTTIEKFFINQKIEKAKELLVYDELSLGEIAFQLGYSSVAHLSAQFKKVTGLTPSYFKKRGNEARKPLDNI